MEILLILFTTLYFLLAWKRLDWALVLMLIALPSYQIRFSVAGFPTTVLEILILVTFAVWLIKNWKRIVENLKMRFNSKFEIRNLKILRYPFDWEIGAILIVSWLAIAVAGFSNSAMGIWKAYFFEPVLVYILIINVFKKDLTKPMWALVISAFLVSAVAIFQRVTGILVVEHFWPRVTGPFPYPNALGLYLGPIVMLLAAWSTTKLFRVKRYPEYKYKTLFVVLSMLMSVTAIILARSEGALAGIIVAGIIIGLFTIVAAGSKLNWLPNTIITLILIFVFSSSWFFLKLVPEHKYFNFNCISANYLSDKLMLKDLSGEIRKQQWRETFKMLGEDKRWLFGTGLSGYQDAVLPYHQEGIFFNFERDTNFRNNLVFSDDEYKATHWQPTEIYLYPHNLILNFWAELGILGALLFIWIVLKFFYLLRDSRDALSLGLLGAMLVLVVHGVVDVPYFKNDLAIIFWVLIALTGITTIKNNESVK